MTKELFDKYVKLAKDSPIIVYGDNMILFTINMQGNHILQDDDGIFSIRVNANSGGNLGISQQESPYECMYFEYDMIQYLKIYPLGTDVLKSMLNGKTPVDDGYTLETMTKEIMSASIMQASSPRGITGADYTVDQYGRIPGVMVSVSKEDEKFVDAAVQYANKKASEAKK